MRIYFRVCHSIITKLSTKPKPGIPKRLEMLQHEQRPLIEEEPLSQTRKVSFWETKNAVIAVVAVALFTDMLVYDTLLPLLPEILLRAHSTPSNAGLLVASYAFGLLFATPFLSYWSDKYRDRKTPIIVGQVGLIFSTVCFVMARSLWLLVAARIMQGSHKHLWFLIFRFCGLGDLDRRPGAGGRRRPSR